MREVQELKAAQAAQAAAKPAKAAASNLDPAAAAAVLAKAASADSVTGKPPLPDATLKRNEGLLTYQGITLYGTVDVGVAYMNHGAPLSTTYGPGLPFLIQKFNNRSITSIAPNGLGQSRVGLTGAEPLVGDLSVVFKLETGFQPTSGNLADGPASLVRNNGVATNKQVTSGDSSRAGQAFQSAAYGGLSSKTWGTLTVGRQNSIILDNLAKYDPQALAQAFSPLGYSGFTAGGGLTESARLDNALKYAYGFGPARFAVMHQFGNGGTVPGGADQADVGLDLAGLSADLTYTHLSDAISLASLNATQAAAAPGTLAGTVSDNTAWTAEGRYVWGPIKLYGGYEHMEFANPSNPVPVNSVAIGNYVMSVVNNTAYTIHRIEKVSWIGARYAISPALDFSFGYYRYDQDSFAAKACSNASSSSCSGTLQDYSAVADYRITRRFDVYGGVNYSSVADGLASGYLQTSAFAPMMGGRFSF